MLEIFECKDCGRYFSEDEMEEKQICYEDEYGVASDFNSRTYTSVACCPRCKSTDYKELDYKELEEVIEMLNDYCPKHSQKYLVKSIIKDLKEKYGVE